MENEPATPSMRPGKILQAGLLTWDRCVQAPSQLKQKPVGMRLNTPPHSVGHVAEFHRLPDSFQMLSSIQNT